MGRPRKVGKCPQHLPNDQKCNACQRGRGCTGMPPVATELDLATESTSEPPRPQPFADTDEHEVPSMYDQLKRKRKAPERFEVDANITSRATGHRWSAQSCCPNHMDAEPSTSEPAPKPKFTGPMDKFLSDKRVEAAVNRAVKSITDNPADLERELRDFAQATRPSSRRSSATAMRMTKAAGACYACTRLPSTSTLHAARKRHTAGSPGACLDGRPVRAR